MRKNIICLIFALTFIIGCGANEKKEFQGVAKSQDYIKEGMMYLKQANLRRAIQSFDMAIKADPQNPQNYIILGQVYLRLKNVDSAIDSFVAATKVDPQSGDAYFLLATSEAVRGHKDDAIKAAEKSAEIFMAKRDEAKFKEALILVKSLSGQNAPALPTEQMPAALPTMQDVSTMDK